MARRGFRVLCVNGRYLNTRREHLIWEQVPLDLKPAVGYLRNLAGVRTVVLVGHSGTVVYSVKSWLSGNAIRVDPERYHVTTDDILGIDWDSSNTSTPANLANVRAPVLIMGMTGHYWMVPSEIFFNSAASQDKQLVFVEGASHNLVPCRACETSAGQYGDRVSTIFDYVAAWLQARFP